MKLTQTSTSSDGRTGGASNFGNIRSVEHWNDPTSTGAEAIESLHSYVGDRICLRPTGTHTDIFSGSNCNAPWSNCHGGVGSG